MQKPILKWILAITILYLALPWSSIIDPAVNIGVLTPDSDQYLQYASKIHGLHIPVFDSPRYLVAGDLLRTPAYPAILVFAILLSKSGMPLGQSILILQSMMWVLLLLSTIFLFSLKLRISKIIISFAVSSFMMRHYATIVMTEWSVYIFLSLFILFIYSILINASALKYLFLGLTFSILTLLRPDYLILFPVSFILIFYKKFEYKKSFFSLLIGLVPLFFWIIFQWTRFDRLTIAPLEGHSFSIMSTLGKGDFSQSYIALKDFSNTVVSNLQFVKLQDLITAPFLETDSFVEKATGNLDIAHNYMADNKISWPKMNLILCDYSKVVLQNNLKIYIYVQIFSMASLIWSLPLIFILNRIRKKYSEASTSPLYKAAYLSIFVHILHVCFVSCINVMHFRYYVPTFAVAVTFVLLATFESMEKKYL